MGSVPFDFYAKQINAAEWREQAEVTEEEVASAYVSYVASKSYDYYMEFLEGRRFLESDDREGIARMVYEHRARKLRREQQEQQEQELFRPARLHYRCPSTGVKYAICMFSQEQRERCIEQMYLRLGQNARYAITDL